MFVRVAILTNGFGALRTFDYHVPKNIENEASVGSKVFVPFGNKKLEGIIIKIYKEPLEKIEYKDIIYACPYLTKDDVRLAIFIAKEYFCPIPKSIELFIHSRRLLDKMIEEKGQSEYISCINEIVPFKKLTKKQNEIVQYILNNSEKSKKRVPYKELKEKFSTNILSTLIKNNVLEKNVEFNISNVYKDIQKNKLYENVIKDLNEIKLHKLNVEQEKVYKDIKKELGNFSEHLIYGVTGSGKTEIYIHLMLDIIKNNKKALMLLPEILLSKEMVERLKNVFGENVSIFHSGQNISEKEVELQKIYTNTSQIIVGPRSCLFLPIHDLGLVIIDEEHDTSYKSNVTPRYETKEVARYMCSLKNIPLVLGSATPEVSQMYRFKNVQDKDNEDNNISKMFIHILRNRAFGVSMPEVEIVDLRYEKSIISERLKEEISKNIKNKEQSLVFINRRGYCPIIKCEHCNEVIKCSHCDLPMNYHKIEKMYKCHHCLRQLMYFSKCPKCGGDLEEIGTGIQKVEEKLTELFLSNDKTIDIDRKDEFIEKEKYDYSIDGYKEVEIIGHEDEENDEDHEKFNIYRVDADKKKGISKFGKDKLSLLLGTQMIIKGHHFSNVTLSVVLLADSMLNMPTYVATEIAFSNIVQAIGRSGREKRGRALIQTYDPTNEIIECARNNDYDTFYKYEIELRRILQLPPFTNIYRITITNKYEKKALQAIFNIQHKLEKLKEIIKKNIEKGQNLDKKEILEIQNCGINKYFANRVAGKYRYDMVLKAPHNDVINKAIRYIISDYENVFVDINPTTF